MSKELFFNMRAEDLALMYSHDFSKMDAELTGLNLANSVFNDGIVEPKKVLSNLVRLKAVIDSAVDKLRNDIDFITKDSFNGVEFNPVNPRESLNYNEDDVWVKLKEQITSRETLIKAATKSNDTIFDSTGCEVPKVSSKFTKSSITIKF